MWIARNKNNDLFFYINEPSKLENTYCVDDKKMLEIDSTYFPDLTFEDGPIKIDLFRPDIYPMTESYEEKLLEEMPSIYNNIKDAYAGGLNFMNNFMSITNKIKWKGDK